tara:strand:- start:129 stop:404 length:276 start_codon:yes stop_codon:yes gene_type:complete
MKNKIKDILARHAKNQTNLASESAQSLLAEEIFDAVCDHITHLEDENSSLWCMLDEIKESEIKNYSEEFRKMMDRKLLEIKMLANMKPGQA